MAGVVLHQLRLVGAASQVTGDKRAFRFRHDYAILNTYDRRGPFRGAPERSVLERVTRALSDRHADRPRHKGEAQAHAYVRSPKSHRAVSFPADVYEE
jgi:hypothetical protein